MPMDRGIPDLVRHCVAAVAKQYGGDTDKAFAICVAQLQKSGYLKPGSMELTAAGKTKEKEHEAEPDAKKKLASYEKLLKANRKEEAADQGKTMVDFIWKKTHKDFKGTMGGRNILAVDSKTGGSTLKYLDSLAPDELKQIAQRLGFKAESVRSVDSPDYVFEALLDRSRKSGYEELPTTVARKHETVSQEESPMAAMRRLAGIK